MIKALKPIYIFSAVFFIFLFVPVFVLATPVITQIQGIDVTEGVPVNLTVSEIEFSGTSAPGTSIEIRCNGRKAAQAVVGGDGQWSASAGSFLTGTYVFHAVREDWPQTPEESSPATVNIDLSGNPLPPAVYSFEINFNSVNNTSERLTVSNQVFLTFFTNDPAGIASAKVSNDNLFWETWNNPPLAPASTAWQLENTEGNKTVYVKFYDADLNESNTVSREIGYFTGILKESGDAASGVYPSSAYDEYTGENRYGRPRTSTIQPDKGSSLKLVVP